MQCGLLQSSCVYLDAPECCMQCSPHLLMVYSLRPWWRCFGEKVPIHPRRCRSRPIFHVTNSGLRQGGGGGGTYDHIPRERCTYTTPIGSELTSMGHTDTVRVSLYTQTHSGMGMHLVSWGITAHTHKHIMSPRRTAL